MAKESVPRREFMKRSATALGALGAVGLAPMPLADPFASSPGPEGVALPSAKYNDVYEGARLNRVAFPMGGIGAGMICLEGTGSLSEFSIRNHPDVFNEPCIFAAISVSGAHPVARVLEGPVPGWKIYGARNSAQGDSGASYGLPRFGHASFRARFPFGVVTLSDDAVPLGVEITGWSPFTPGDVDSSSLPAVALEYRFTNTSRQRVNGVFSFNIRNFLPLDGRDKRGVRAAPGGFTLWSAGAAAEPGRDAALTVTVDEPGVKVNHAWFRGGWWDPLTMAWRDVEKGEAYDKPPITEGEPSPGATLFVPIDLAPGVSRTIAVRIAWLAGDTTMRIGTDPPSAPPATGPDRYYRPWYAGRFTGVEQVTAFWREHYRDLRTRSGQFADCFHDTTLPAEVIEAVSANLGILKSPTLLRQTDGKFWAF